MADDDVRILTIMPGRPPAGDPGTHPRACILQWGPLEWYAPVEAVRETALDLVKGMAYAQMAAKLIKLGLPKDLVPRFVSDVIGDIGKDHLGSKDTIRIYPGGLDSGQPCVIIKRGKISGRVAGDAAFTMAQQWLTAAETTESDETVVRVLRERLSLPPDAEETFFAHLRELRTPDERAT